MEPEIAESPESVEAMNDLQKEFLFDISKEVSLFYETPVIFLTKKDFSDIIFDTMCNIRKVLQGTTKEDKTAIIDIIVDFHLEWLRAVVEIENYIKSIPTLPRDEVYTAVSYTINAMEKRLKYYKIFMERKRFSLNNSEQANMTADLEIIEEMHREVTLRLLDKLRCFRNYTDDNEFSLKIREAAEELLLWIDKINDALSMLLTKFINPNVPLLTGDLTKTLQQIVDELETSKSQKAQELVQDLKQRGQQLSTMIRCTTDRSLEISKVMQKINILDDRIKCLGNEPTSAAVMALQHKKNFLERKLESLENLKTTLNKLKDATIRDFDADTADKEMCICEDFYHMRIFNHSLPQEEREHLVTELCYLWDLAVFGQKSDRSVISILSAGELKEEFSDEIGTFFIDENGRKIYKLAGDSTLYQLNELDDLVPLADDPDRIYFYDQCGRYYKDSKTRENVYKADATASEYMMEAGVLLKVKEVHDGVTFFYDSFGRYYINEDGRNIYRDEDATSEYENDGLGNLVRVRSRADLFDLCPGDVNVTEDFQYLKLSVGQALRECIADCVLRQPTDPIKFLSARLLKYRENFELRETMAREKEALQIEKEFVREQERIAAEKAAMEVLQAGSEATSDSNLHNYTTFVADALATSPRSSN